MYIISYIYMCIKPICINVGTTWQYTQVYIIIIIINEVLCLYHISTTSFL